MPDLEASIIAAMGKTGPHEGTHLIGVPEETSFIGRVKANQPLMSMCARAHFATRWPGVA